MAKRWTAEEDRNLLMGLGAYGVSWFLPRVGRPYNYSKWSPKTRTKKALYDRVRKLLDGGGLGRGAYSLAQLVKNSGYSSSQIMRAREALNQKWKRITPNGAYIITEEQSEDVLEWLKHDYWALHMKLYACTGCGTKAKPHHRGGMCCSCFFKSQRALKLHKLPGGTKALLARLNERATVQRVVPDSIRMLGDALALGRSIRWQDVPRLHQWLSEGSTTTP